MGKGRRSIDAVKLAGDMDFGPGFSVLPNCILWMPCWVHSGLIPHKRRQRAIEAYHREAEEIIDREIAFYSLSTDKTLLPAPSPITKARFPIPEMK